MDLPLSRVSLPLYLILSIPRKLSAYTQKEYTCLNQGFYRRHLQILQYILQSHLLSPEEIQNDTMEG